MSVAAALLAPGAALAAGAVWFHRSFVRMTVRQLRPDIFLAMGGGGNTLVVTGRHGAVVVDTKFGPGAAALDRWLRRSLRRPVTAVVNTHFHYDHTQGNVRYPEAEIWAHAAVPALMRQRDGEWWRDRVDAVPTRLVGDDGGELDDIGTRLILGHPGVAHTRGDLYVHVPSSDIVATGDLLFHTYYPFLDTGPGGAAIPAWVRAVRGLAKAHPDALFVPGHGPPAAAGDLLRYADYLERLHTAVAEAHARGMSRARAVRAVDMRERRLSILPSFHKNRLSWATPRNNVRWAYDLVSAAE